MLKIAVTGANGKMGQAIVAAIAEDKACCLAQALTRQDQLTEKFDVLVDFTLPLATSYYLKRCVELSRPMIIGTTGLNSKEQNALQDAAKSIPIVFAPNMSIGINICYNLLATCVKLITEDWQIAISETHHQHKKDAPSGTALKMAEVITANSGLAESALQINSCRIGEVTGEHTALFVGAGESIEITHRAFNRQAFASGAILAAKWVLNQKPGLYSMQDVLAAKKD